MLVVPTENQLMIAHAHQINSNASVQATYKTEVEHLLANKTSIEFTYGGIGERLILLGDTKSQTIEGYHYAGECPLLFFIPWDEKLTNHCIYKFLSFPCPHRYD